MHFSTRVVRLSALVAGAAIVAAVAACEESTPTFSGPVPASVTVSRSTGAETAKVLQFLKEYRGALETVIDGVTDEMWAADVRKSFDGEVVVGRDLMEI